MDLVWGKIGFDLKNVEKKIKYKPKYEKADNICAIRRALYGIPFGSSTRAAARRFGSSAIHSLSKKHS